MLVTLASTDSARILGEEPERHEAFREQLRSLTDTVHSSTSRSYIRYKPRVTNQTYMRMVRGA